MSAANQVSPGASGIGPEWVFGQEPHRAYEPGSGLRAGKKLADVVLPKYYPDNRIIRSDMLDYALEVEWFDQHLGRAMKKLEQIGELDNTLIVVTSDHGMPFPRVKGQIYEHGFHIPLAICWGKNIKAGRTVDDFINTRDFAPTFMAVAGLDLPAAARRYLDRLQEMVETPITYVSVGTRRDQIIGL